MTRFIFIVFLLLGMMSQGCFENLSKDLGNAIFDSFQGSMEVSFKAIVAAKKGNISDYEKYLTSDYKNKENGQKYVSDFKKLKKVSSKMKLDLGGEPAFEVQKKSELVISGNATSTMRISLDGSPTVEFDTVCINNEWKIDDIR